MESTVERHPQKAEIIQMLLSGMSSRKIAASVSPPLDFHAIQRFNRSVVRPSAIKVTLAEKALSQQVQGVAAVQPHLARIAQRQADLDAVAGAAVQAGDGRTVAAIATADYKGIELAMRATGLLDGPGTVNVTNTLYVVTGLPGSVDTAEPAIDIAPDNQR